MKKDIIIPAAGESVTEADITSWYKENGDYVDMDEPIVELETDKASMDLPAEISGILSIDIDSGTVTVGQVIGSIEASEAPATATETPDTTSAQQPVTTAPAKMQFLQRLIMRKDFRLRPLKNY